MCSPCSRFLLGGVVPLTALAWLADHRGPDAADYLKAVTEAEEESARAVELAGSPAGIPPTGAITLIRRDPMIAGRRLFVQQCGQLPRESAAFGRRRSERTRCRSESDQLCHGANGLRACWLRTASLALITSGGTAHHAGEMVGFVQDDLKKWSAEDVQNVVVALSAEAHLKSQIAADAAAKEQIEAGRKKLADTDTGCAQCHKFHDVGEGGPAPDLTGYGSRAWLQAFCA